MGNPVQPVIYQIIVNGVIMTDWALEVELIKHGVSMTS